MFEIKYSTDKWSLFFFIWHKFAQVRWLLMTVNERSLTSYYCYEIDVCLTDSTGLGGETKI